MAQLIKIYSYTSGIAETKTLPGGRFFRLLKATAPVDVEFFAESGDSLGKAEQILAGLALSLEPSDIGQRSRLIGFAKVRITSATAQEIQAAISRQRVEYDRSAGSVDATIVSSARDGEIDALAARAFAGWSIVTQGPAERPICQLWNPVGSGVVVLLDKFLITPSVAAKTLRLQIESTERGAEPVAANFEKLNLFGGGAAPVAEMNVLSHAAAIPFDGIMRWIPTITPDVDKAYRLPSPIVLPAGFGASFHLDENGAGNATLQLNAWWREQ